MKLIIFCSQCMHNLFCKACKCVRSMRIIIHMHCIGISASDYQRHAPQIGAGTIMRKISRWCFLNKKHFWSNQRAALFILPLLINVVSIRTKLSRGTVCIRKTQSCARAMHHAQEKKFDCRYCSQSHGSYGCN